MPQQSYIRSFITLSALCSAEILYSFPTQSDHTPGLNSIRYEGKSKVWFETSFIAVDGKIRTSPPDRIYLDRRVEANTAFGFDWVFTPNFGFRNLTLGSALLRRAEEKEPPKSPEETKFSSLDISYEIVYTTPKGLEIGLGKHQRELGPKEQTFISPTTSSKGTENPASLSCNQVILTKRSPSWAGSLYYIEGVSKKRSYGTEASDGSVNWGTSSVHIPTQYGIAANFTLSGYRMEFSLGMVQSSSGSEQSEGGFTTQDDYLSGNFNTYIPSGGLITKIKLGHQTISYSNNAFMNLDTIPINSIGADILLGGIDSYLLAGIFYANGSDGQSIPEFNAKYDQHALGFTFGFKAPF